MDKIYATASNRDKASYPQNGSYKLRLQMKEKYRELDIDAVQRIVDCMARELDAEVTIVATEIKRYFVTSEE